MNSITLLSPEFEDIRHEKGEILYQKSARNTFRLLWLDWDFDLNQYRGLNLLKVLFNHRNPLTVFIQTLFVKKNPQFIYVARKEIQTILENFANELALIDMTRLNDEEQLKIHFTLHNILSIYVMFEPHPKDRLIIPQLIKDEESKVSWQKVCYQTTPIDLSPDNLTWKMVLTDDSRVFSYGFSPITHQQTANSLLVHSGTTWPMAQGSKLQYLTDMWPQKTPGESFIEWQYDRLKCWIEKQPNKITTCGQSLGGSLAILSQFAFPEKIKKIYPLSPTALVRDYKNDTIFGKWHKLPPEQKIYADVQIHPGDLVFYLGWVPNEGLNLHSLKPCQTNQQFHDFGPLVPHMRSHASNKFSKLTPYNIERENNKPIRHFFNKYLGSYVRAFFYYLSLAAFFIYSPCKHLINQNKLRISLFIVGILAAFLFPPISTAILTIPFLPHFSSVLLTTILPVFLISTVITKTYHFLKAPKENIRQLTGEKTLLNLLSLGLYSDGITIINKVKKLYQAKNTPYAKAKIHTDQYLEDAKNLSKNTEPSLWFKLGLSAIIGLIAVISTPILFCGFIIKKCFWDLPKWAFQCCFKKTASEHQQTAEDKSVSCTPTTKVKVEKRSKKNPSFNLLTYLLKGNACTDKSKNNDAKTYGTRAC